MYFMLIKNQNIRLRFCRYLLALILNVILPHKFVHTLKVRLSWLQKYYNFQLLKLLAPVNDVLCSTLPLNLFGLINFSCPTVQLVTCTAVFDSRIIGLTGPVAAVRQMAQEYRVYFKKVEEDGDDYLVDISHSM